MTHPLVKEWCRELSLEPKELKRVTVGKDPTPEAEDELIRYCREQVLRNEVAAYCLQRNLDYQEYVSAMYNGGLTEDLKDSLIAMHREWMKEKL